MLLPKFTLLTDLFWKWYIAYLVWADFGAMRVRGQVRAQPGKAVLLIANHYGWWDGFWLYHLNERLFKKRFYVMMLEENLRKFWPLRYAGAFSVNKRGRQMLESLDYAADLLGNSNSLVLIFPQGRFESMWVQEPVFEKGLLRLLQKAQKPVQVVLCANLVEYEDGRKPYVVCDLHELPHEQCGDLQSVKQAFLAHLQAAKLRQISAVDKNHG